MPFQTLKKKRKGAVALRLWSDSVNPADMETIRNRHYRREVAADFISRTLLNSRSSRTLAKFAISGGGPPYRYCGVSVYYVTDLTAWARKETGPKVRSATEARALKAGAA